jgi:phage FluMu protein Com
MYEIRCPHDGKLLARIARPPLSELRYAHECACGRSVKGKVLVEAATMRIIGQVHCPCGMSTTRILGYLVTVKCKRCKAIVKF